jgi:two-component system sensor histidine kinase AgrC
LIRRKLILNEGKIIEQEKINKTLLNVNDELKCFKHDFYNILQSINGYIYLNDLIGLKKYYDNLLAEINEIEYFEMIAKNLKNNPAVFGVLLDKFKKSKEKGIELFVELNHKMQTLGIKNYNVSRMLGVLIDNAIEASAECDNSLVCVNFKEDIEDNCIYIEVKNNYDKNNELDMKKIYDKHYTTKNNSNNQGLGLWKVGKIVMKNEDFNIYTTVEDDVFIQNLKICV